MNKLLKTEELAEILNVRKNTLEIWRHEGRGPVFVRIGRAVRYRHEDVQAFLAASLAQNTCRNVCA